MVWLLVTKILYISIERISKTQKLKNCVHNQNICMRCIDLSRDFAETARKAGKIVFYEIHTCIKPNGPAKQSKRKLNRWVFELLSAHKLTSSHRRGYVCIKEINYLTSLEAEKNYQKLYLLYLRVHINPSVNKV